MTCSADDRLKEVRISTDVVWLEKVRQRKFTEHLTVRSAARRRLRVLAKQSAKSATSAVKKSEGRDR
jgi:hypothetical protein